MSALDFTKLDIPQGMDSFFNDSQDFDDSMPTTPASMSIPNSSLLAAVIVAVVVPLLLVGLLGMVLRYLCVTRPRQRKKKVARVVTPPLTDTPGPSALPQGAAETETKLILDVEETCTQDVPREEIDGHAVQAMEGTEVLVDQNPVVNSQENANEVEKPDLSETCEEARETAVTEAGNVVAVAASEYQGAASTSVDSNGQDTEAAKHENAEKVKPAAKPRFPHYIEVDFLKPESEEGTTTLRDGILGDDRLEVAYATVVKSELKVSSEPTAAMEMDESIANSQREGTREYYDL